MKCLLSVCLATSLCIGVAVDTALRQVAAETHALQKGIHVEMATAHHAQAWPDADDNDAWVVTVDSTGGLYFEANPMTLEGLKQWMIRHPRRRDQKVYIKADARVSYASVEKALDAASMAEFAAPVLLVNEVDRSARPGIVVPPKGMDVSVGSATPSGTAATVVELIFSKQQQPLVKINDDEIPLSTLDETLKRRFQKGDDQVVLLTASGRLPYAEVVHAIDSCRAAGARVYLGEPGL